MTSDQWQRARPVLTQAIALDPGERDRLLQSAFAGDSRLHGQILDIVKQYGAATLRFPGASSPRAGPKAADVAGAKGAADFVLDGGDMCGRYRIVRPLGVGGMGQVYLAEDVDLGTPAALKLVSSPWLDSPDARAHLRREAARAAQLRYHPHIATVLQLMETDVKGASATVLVMEYVAGRPAYGFIAEGPVRCERALGWAVQVARAMEFAHERGLVHCDIKPANIQIEERSSGDHVKVLDFGIARAMFENPPPEGLAGTPAYMSPEQLTAGTCGAAADIYALGVTLFELLTGRRPYDALDPEELLLQIIAGPVPRVSAYTRVPRALDDVLQRAMAKAPEDRYRSMTEFRQALEAVMPAAPVAGMPLPLRIVAGAAIAFAFVALLGFAAAQALDQGLGRVQPVRATSVFSWFYWGARSLVAPVVTSLVFVLAFLCGVAVVRLFATIPPVGRLARRLARPFRGFADSLAQLSTSSLAQALLLTHVALLVAVGAYFAPLLGGFTNFMLASRGSIDVLRPSNQPMHELYGYLVTAELLVFCVAWFNLLRLRARRRERDGLPYIAAGIAAIAASAFLFTARFKILSHNDSERVVYNEQACYLIEERGATGLLFCPLTYPRNVVAPLGAVERTGNIENIFSALDR